MILERFSRSASACLAMARRMDSGRSTCLTSTLTTFTPQGAVWVSRMLCKRMLILSRWASNSSNSTSPRTERSVVELRSLVAGDDVLRWYLDCFLAQRNPHHAVDRHKHQ